MVRFRTIDLKSHPISQFEENRIIRKKMLNRVPKCDVIENEICEIMGFVKLF